MSERIGKILKCDRCGTEVFLKYIAPEPIENGITRSGMFEKTPAGWSYTVPRSDISALCPSCNKAYKKLIDDFIRAYSVK